MCVEAEPKDRVATPWKPFYMLMDFSVYLSISGVPLLQVSSCLESSQWSERKIRLIENKPAERQAAAQLPQIQLKTRTDLDGELHAVRRSNRLNEKATWANRDGKTRRSEKNGETRETKAAVIPPMNLLNSKGK